MNTLFVNAAFRQGSRSLELAEFYLRNRVENEGRDVIRLELGDGAPAPLNRESLKVYNASVAGGVYEDAMFDAGRQSLLLNLKSTPDFLIVDVTFKNYKR